MPDAAVLVDVDDDDVGGVLDVLGVVCVVGVAGVEGGVVVGYLDV